MAISETRNLQAGAYGGSRIRCNSMDQNYDALASDMRSKFNRNGHQLLQDKVHGTNASGNPSWQPKDKPIGAFEHYLTAAQPYAGPDGYKQFMSPYHQARH